MLTGPPTRTPTGSSSRMPRSRSQRTRCLQSPSTTPTACATGGRVCSTTSPGSTASKRSPPRSWRVTTLRTSMADPCTPPLTPRPCTGGPQLYRAAAALVPSSAPSRTSGGPHRPLARTTPAASALHPAWTNQGTRSWPRGSGACGWRSCSGTPSSSPTKPSRTWCARWSWPPRSSSTRAAKGGGLVAMPAGGRTKRWPWASTLERHGRSKAHCWHWSCSRAQPSRTLLELRCCGRRCTRTCGGCWTACRSRTWQWSGRW
mmetsp:Transcript_56134/g.131533  ORF Transcript_56134/g.131533 Transcript_56134/m.131533 type:complete len:260 (-) Transcript_56134:656-1435(-)